MLKSYKKQLPTPVRMRAEAIGESGLQWMAGLDESVANLEQKWRMQVGNVLTGGSESLVAEVSLKDGKDAILKIGLPDSADLAKEAKVFALASGRGYVDLIAHEPAQNALLLEKLGKTLSRKVSPVDAQIRLICQTLQEAWIPLDSAHGLMTGAEKAIWLKEFILEKWELLRRPCDKKIVDMALLFTEERADAFSVNHSVLVHGDAHADNTLFVSECNEDGEMYCKFIDPDGLFAEKACDLAVPMRDWSDELLAGDILREGKKRCELLAELTGVDAHAIWQWGFIERVSTGFVLLEIGMKTEGVKMLSVADQFCHT